MATFHVDYINGSDSNDGSAANPYATMKYALEFNSLGAGDDLKVAGSAMTTRDSAATYSDAVGYNILTTSADLTGSISVGDIIQINPPSGNTQYQDWLMVQVTAITATTITLYEEIHLPGTMPTGNWTIKTVDSIYENSSGTMETWADATVGANVSIIGGYNTAFTSIVGLTYFRRGGLGAGASSGICIKNQYTNNVLDIAEFQNFQFLQWNECIKGEFGGSIYGTNLRAMFANGNIFAYFGTVIGKSYTPDLYFINCNSLTGQYDYTTAAVADPNLVIIQDVTTFCSHKSIKMQATFNDLTIWNPGQNGLGAEFGATTSVRCDNKPVTQQGVLTFNTIDNARSGFRKGHNIFQLDTSLTCKPTAINVLTGGLTTGYWDFSPSFSGAIKGFISSIICPTGFLIKEQLIRCDREMKSNVMPNVQLQDADGTWLKISGGYVTVSDDFDTGDSSKLFFFGNNLAYATDQPKSPIFEFNKAAGAAPVSFTVRGKVDPQGTGATTVSIIPEFANYQQFGVMFGVASWTTNTYADAVFTFPTGYAWDQIPVGAPVQVAGQFYSGRNQLLFIDSITVNY